LRTAHPNIQITLGLPVLLTGRIYVVLLMFCIRLPSALGYHLAMMSERATLAKIRSFCDGALDRLDSTGTFPSRRLAAAKPRLLCISNQGGDFSIPLEGRGQIASFLLTRLK
jgi:hypothetical protein